jgi:hypothetical protein
MRAAMLEVEATYVFIMRRKMVWIEKETFCGWGCSQCAWEFRPSGTLAGKSLDEMKKNYLYKRDKAFALHVCGKHANKP